MPVPPVIKGEKSLDQSTVGGTLSSLMLSHVASMRTPGERVIERQFPEQGGGLKQGYQANSPSNKVIYVPYISFLKYTLSLSGRKLLAHRVQMRARCPHDLAPDLHSILSGHTHLPALSSSHCIFFSPLQG